MKDNYSYSIRALCDKYKFKTKYLGINDNFYCEVQAKNIDEKYVSWFDIQLSNHQSAYGNLFEPLIFIYGNTASNNIWFCDTRKDLLLKDIIDFCKQILKICNCKLVTEYSTKDDEVSIDSLISLEDLQKFDDYISFDELKKYIDFDEVVKEKNNFEIEME